MEKWLVTGAGGQFGSVLLRQLTAQQVPALGFISPAGPAPRSGATLRCDLTVPDQMVSAVRGFRPDVIVHAGAVTSVQSAYERPDQARQVNIEATRVLVELAVEMGAKFLFTSTDLVFDGHSAPYCETRPVAPLSTYARTKVEAEKFVLNHDRGVVLRTALMYGWAAVIRQTTFKQQFEAIRGGTPVRLFEDEFRTPIWLEDAAAAARRIAASDFAGVIHVGGPERLSRLDMGYRIARALGNDGAGIAAIRQSELHSPEPRPADVSLNCDRYIRQFGAPPGREMNRVMTEIVGERTDRECQEYWATEIREAASGKENIHASRPDAD